MKHFIRLGIILGLLMFLSMSIPIYADTLVGDENGTAIGSTSVTARVELPENYEPDASDPDGTESSDINTGDQNQIMMYIFMILLSALTTAIVLKAETNKNGESH